jgi:hypothetical protein
MVSGRRPSYVRPGAADTSKALMMARIILWLAIATICAAMMRNAVGSSDCELHRYNPQWLDVEHQQTLVENRVKRVPRSLNFTCPVCGSTSAYGLHWDGHPRESGRCSSCGATNRHRQLAYVLLKHAALLAERSFASLRKIKISNAVIYNTQSSGPIHDQLQYHIFRASTSAR